MDLVKAGSGVALTDGQRRPHRRHPVAQGTALDLRPDRHGHHRLEDHPVGVVALAAQVLAQGHGHGGEHDVVDLAAQRILDRLQAGQVGVYPRVTAVGTDRHVERRGGRWVHARPGHRPDPHQAVAHAGGYLAWRPQGRPRPANHLPGHGGSLHQRPGQQLGRGGHRTGCPGLVLGCHRGGRVGGIEQDRGDVDARDTVHQRVVGLADQGKAVSGQALDHPHLPQRLAAVQRLGEQPPGEALELLWAAGGRQRGVPQVVVGLEVRIVDPYRATLPEGHVGQALAVARDQVQAADHVLDQLRIGGRLSLKDEDRRHVHVGATRLLEMQEGGVETGQAIEVGHAAILAVAPGSVKPRPTGLGARLPCDARHRCRRTEH